MSIVDVEQLASRVDRLERELEEMRATVKCENPASLLAAIEPFNQKVAEISLQCFPEPVQFKASSDFETKETFFVVMARHGGDSKEMAAASIKWHTLMAGEMNNVSHFYRLSVRSL
jgi:hypothetical protein